MTVLTWLIVGGTGLAVSLAVSLIVALWIGRVVRNRDRQIPRDEP